MSGAVSAYKRIKARYPEAGGADYPNRATASRIFQRQFNQLMDETGLKHDPVTERRSAASIAFGIPRSACASSSHTARSTSSISRRMLARALSRSSASMPGTCRSHARWRRTCRALGRSSRAHLGWSGGDGFAGASTEVGAAGVKVVCIGRKYQASSSVRTTHTRMICSLLSFLWSISNFPARHNFKPRDPYCL